MIDLSNIIEYIKENNISNRRGKEAHKSYLLRPLLKSSLRLRFLPCSLIDHTSSSQDSKIFLSTLRRSEDLEGLKSGSRGKMAASPIFFSLSTHE